MLNAIFWFFIMNKKLLERILIYNHWPKNVSVYYLQEVHFIQEIHSFVIDLRYKWQYTRLKNIDKNTDYLIDIFWQNIHSIIRKYLFWKKYLQITNFLCFLLFMMPYGSKCLLYHYKQCIWLSFGIYDYGYILRQISLAIISVKSFT